LDVILYNYQLSQNVGAEGLLVLTVLVQSSAALREFYPFETLAPAVMFFSSIHDTAVWHVYGLISSVSRILATWSFKVE
jgi:hypothetical protein